jgi:hypothetical protein
VKQWKMTSELFIGVILEGFYIDVMEIDWEVLEI